MKITHLAKFYPPEWGGIESVTQELALGSAQAGHDVSVVAFTHKPQVRERAGGVAIHRHRILMTAASQPLSFSYLWRAWGEGRRADIVHVHYPNLLAALPLALLGRRPRIVLHWHSDVLNKGLLGRLIAPIESWLARRADRIIATSPTYAAASPILSRHRDKVDVVALGISDPTATEVQGTLPEEIAVFLGDRGLALAVGRLVPYKGFHRLLEVASAMQCDGAIIVVGTGPLEAELREKVRRRGLEKRLLLAGRVDDRTLRLLFARASVYVMTSTDRAEAFGVVLLEAMANRLPVVMTEIPGSGAPWVAPDGMVGITVAPDDKAALAGAIDALIADTAQRDLYARAARERFEETFTSETMLRKTLALYERLGLS